MVGCHGEGKRTPPNVASASTAPASDAREAQPLPDTVWRGVCFAHDWQARGVKGYGSPESAAELDHLKSLGVTWISITPFGFMPELTATELRGEHNEHRAPPGAETAERLRRVTAQAKERGLKIMLKPHIWVHGGKWRGRIKPLDENGKLTWERWWDSHDAWILFYARLAEELEIESLVIGLELHSAVAAHPERLVGLAAKVREVYAGHITYAANWNEPVPDEVWSAVDGIGVQFYPPLADTGEPFSEATLRARLRKHLDDWSAVAQRVRRPLVITEVGYRSADLAVRMPNAWPEKHEAQVDEALQRQAYALFLDELGRTPEAGGVFLWKYFTNAATDEEGPTGFSPRGKPAEDVIRSFFSPRR